MPSFSFSTYALLGLLNRLTPKARGSRRVAAGRAYGPAARQKLDVYAPRTGAGPWPLVVFFYGGSWNAGERRYYEFAGRALAAAGFVVAIPDYRLVPEVEYPVFLDDCADAVAFMVRHAAEFGADPSRLALAGHSAGAYNAAMLALDPRYLAVRGLRGPLKAMALLSGPFDFYPFDVAASLRAFGGVAEPLLTQPVNRVTPGLPPFWLGHGNDDTLVSPRNAVALARALRDAGVDVTERHFPDLGHAGMLLALGGPTRRKGPVLAEMTAFLADQLAADRAPILAPSAAAAYDPSMG